MCDKEGHAFPTRLRTLEAALAVQSAAQLRKIEQLTSRIARLEEEVTNKVLQDHQPHQHAKD
jgi:hypothetical protein